MGSVVAVDRIERSTEEGEAKVSMDAKWQAVQSHYIQAYPDHKHLFKSRLKDSAVNELYDRMLKLEASKVFYEELDHKFRQFANQPLKEKK